MHGGCAAILEFFAVFLNCCMFLKSFSLGTSERSEQVLKIFGQSFIGFVLICSSPLPDLLIEWLYIFHAENEFENGG